VSGNSIQYGTGGLNIDACRIATDEVRKYQTRRKPSAAMGDRAAIYGGGKGPGEHINPPHPGGRFPANIIFQHQPGCRCVGTREESYQINRWADGAKPFGGGAGHPFTSEAPVTSVPIWDCAPGCAVAVLDTEDRPSGAIKPYTENPIAATSFKMEREKTYTKEPETGGASRYFFTVGGQR
jgi:hypothetical protein